MYLSRRWLFRAVFVVVLAPLVALPLGGIPRLGDAPPVSSSLAATTGEARATAALPLAFEANRGQHDPAIRFLARSHAGVLALTPDALTLALASPRSVFEDADAYTHGKRQAESAAESTLPALVRLAFAGANPEATMTAEEPLPGVVNYLIGNDPTAWHTGVPTSARVRYRGLYPGVEVTVFGAPGGWEYDVFVAPGADPAAFAFAVAGAVHADVNAGGELVLVTPTGQEVRHHAPVAWQEAGGVREPVAVRFDLRDDGSVGFAVGWYDHALPLVIDPPVYATYLGGGENDGGGGVAVDASGAAYVAGSTSSTNFPVTPGAARPTSGGDDAFVAKLNATGTAFVYATYLGGSGGDYGSGVAVDASGMAYVTGSTTSTDFPATMGAAQATFGGGAFDAFVVKLNATGTAFVYATYLGGGGVGGSGTDGGNGIAVDGSGAAYITGETRSMNFPVTIGVAQATYGGSGTYGGDAFVVKVNATGTAFVYATYLGGSGDDSGRGIAVDGSGTAYVMGRTESTSFPVTPGAAQAIYGGGIFDAFVAKLNTEGTNFVYATYLGGSVGDQGNGIAVDGGGAAYITGATSSTNFPITSGAVQATSSGGSAFVSKLNTTGTGFVYSTCLGGGGEDFGNGIAVDGSGAAYIIGYTSSTNFPVTPGAAQATLGAFNGDAFVAKLNAGGTALVYATYLGGDDYEYGKGIAVDGGGMAYVTGQTRSTNFPVTPGSAQATYGGTGMYGRGDGFVAKLDLRASLPPALAPTTYIAGTTGSPLTLTGTNLSTGTTVVVDGAVAPVLSAAPDGTSLIVRVPAHAVGSVTLTATNPGTTAATALLTYVMPNAAPSYPRTAVIPDPALPAAVAPPRAVPTLAMPPSGTLPTPTPLPAPVRRGGP